MIYLTVSQREWTSIQPHWLHYCYHNIDKDVYHRVLVVHKSSVVEGEPASTEGVTGSWSSLVEPAFTQEVTSYHTYQLNTTNNNNNTSYHTYQLNTANNNNN